MERAFSLVFMHKTGTSDERFDSAQACRSGGHSHSPTSESFSGESSLETSRRRSLSVPAEAPRDGCNDFAACPATRTQDGSSRVRAATPPPSLSDPVMRPASKGSHPVYVPEVPKKRSSKHTATGAVSTSSRAAENGIGSASANTAPPKEGPPRSSSFVSGGSGTVTVASRCPAPSASPPSFTAHERGGTPPPASLPQRRNSHLGHRATEDSHTDPFDEGCTSRGDTSNAPSTRNHGFLGRPRGSSKRKTVSSAGRIAAGGGSKDAHRNEPFDEESNGSSLSPASNESAEDVSGGPSSSCAASKGSGATGPVSSVPPPTQAPAAVVAKSSGASGFYFYTRPRLGRFTKLIAFLLSLGDLKTLECGFPHWPEAVREQYRKLLALPYLISLCDEAATLLSHEPALLDVKVNVDREEMVVVGDIHGQFIDLHHSVLSQQCDYRTKNKERKDKTFLFLGDFVDRGPNSLETILLVLALKVEYPHLIFLIRGNHEEKTTSRVYGFLTEVQQKLGKDEGAAVWEIVTSTFASLPLSATVRVVNKKQPEHNFSFFATHGGLAPGLAESVESISGIKRENYGVAKEKTALSFLPPVSSEGKEGGAVPLSSKDEEVCKGLMWSDPSNDVGLFGRNPRGCGFLFGPAASEAFCTKNRFEFIVRAHQVVMDGYLWKHDDRVLTVFSAPNYCGINGNMGAIMIVRKQTSPSRPSIPSCSAGVERPWRRYISFEQYDAADLDETGIGNDDMRVQPSLQFPYASCFL